MQYAKHFGKHKRHLVWRATSLAVVGLMLASVIASVYFIYIHVYRILNNQIEIVILSANANLETVDVVAYDKAKKLLATKEADFPTTTLRNIFLFPASTTLTHASSTSSTTR